MYASRISGIISVHLTPPLLRGRILDQLDIPENLGRFVGTFGLPPSLLAQALRVQTCGGNDEIYASISQLNEKSGGIIQIVKEVSTSS